MSAALDAGVLVPLGIVFNRLRYNNDILSSPLTSITKPIKSIGKLGLDAAKGDADADKAMKALLDTTRIIPLLSFPTSREAIHYGLRKMADYDNPYLRRRMEDNNEKFITDYAGLE